MYPGYCRSVHTVPLAGSAVRPNWEMEPARYRAKPGSGEILDGFRAPRVWAVRVSPQAKATAPSSACRFSMNGVGEVQGNHTLVGSVSRERNGSTQVQSYGV